MKKHSSSSSKGTPSVDSPASPKTRTTFANTLSTKLSTLQTHYTSCHPSSLKAHNEACEDFPGGNTRTVLHASPFPLTFVNGNRCQLTCLDNCNYIDFLGEFTAGIYGHSNPVIASAVSEAMKQGWNYGGPNVYERELASKVTERFSPSGVELVRFTNSGTEANTMALAAAVAFTGRKKIMAFKNGYHGGTLSFPSTLNDINTNLPHDFVLAPYNDVAGTQAVISSLPKDSLAAIIVELVQGSGGSIPGDPSFLRFLNKSAKHLGALFIVDEVMTSRLSYHGLSFELCLTPDLVTLGKWVGGGMTFGAFGGRRDGGIMSMFDPRSGILAHSGTFNNNIVTMAAGCAGMDIYDQRAVQELNALGDGLRSALQSLLAKYDVNQTIPTAAEVCPKKNELESPFTGTKSSPHGTSVDSLFVTKNGGMWVSGRGSMMSIHFSGPNEKALQALFWHYLLAQGIYLAQRGFVALSIELKKAHIDLFVDAVEQFLLEYGEALR